VKLQSSGCTKVPSPSRKSGSLPSPKRRGKKGAMEFIKIGVYFSSFILSAAMNALCGISTLPYWRIFFLPSFCLSRSLRLRDTSPP